MESYNLIESFSAFKEVKNIDRSTLMSIIEGVFRNMLIKKYGSDENFDIIVNPDRGDIEIWQNREIVDEEFAEDSFDYNEGKHISLTQALKIDGDFKIGEEVTTPVKFDDFGRRAVLAVRQNLISKILELEKDSLYKKYKDKIGEIITSEVSQIKSGELHILDGDGNLLLLPKSEQISSDFYKKGDNIRAVVQRVEMKNNTPVVILSRSSSAFLERLFELEVPEVFDGLITIKKIVRHPGERAKVVVESYDDRIDPVGTCIGSKGMRIRSIIYELRGENIDVINFTNNTSLLITRALSPAKITSVKIDDEKKRAEVFLKSDQVPLAIGRGGHNIKLTSKLTGYEIDIYGDGDGHVEDVDLEEFRDEIESWILEELKNIGCDTAKSVLELTTEELVKRTDLEEVTVNEVKAILQSEFE